MTIHDQQIDVLSRFIGEPVDAGILAQFEQGIAEYAGRRGTSAANSGFPLFAAMTWRQFIRRWHQCFASTGTNARLTHLPTSRGPYTSKQDIDAISNVLKEINAMRDHLLSRRSP